MRAMRRLSGELEEGGRTRHCARSQLRQLLEQAERARDLPVILAGRFQAHLS